MPRYATKQGFAAARQSLTTELLGYVLLRLTRHFIEDEYEMLADNPKAIELDFRSIFPFNASAQRHGGRGAFVNANTVAAFNRSHRTLIDLGVVECAAGAISKVVVPFAELDEHLQSLEANDVFESSLYHFFNCHSQTEWGSPSFGLGTEVEIRPGLQDRFADAKLLLGGGDELQWSPLLLQCIAPFSPESSARNFFREIYEYEEHER